MVEMSSARARTTCRGRDAAAVPRSRPLLREGASAEVVRCLRGGGGGAGAAGHVHQHRRADTLDSFSAVGRREPAADRRRESRRPGDEQNDEDAYRALDEFMRAEFGVASELHWSATTTSPLTGSPTSDACHGETSACMLRPASPSGA